MLRRVISTIILVTFSTLSIYPQELAAQVLSASPAGGQAASLSSSALTHETVFNGIKIYPQEPFRFDFLVDERNSPQPSLYKKRGSNQLEEGNPPSFYKEGARGSYSQSSQDEYLKLIKYFMASLTVPEGDLWVNLSPVEPDRIVPHALGQTEMGRDLLSQDYILKQLTASLMSPEGEAGKKFWEKIYQKIYEDYNSPQPPLYTKRGSDQLSEDYPPSFSKEGARGSYDQIIESFNKVWIVPNEVEVYQNGDVAYITKATLKVMMEEDYLSSVIARSEATKQSQKDEIASQKALAMTEETKNIIRSVIIPVIEHEVNEGESFANLRQIFHSMILAKWYEQHFKNSILGQSYVDRNVVEGIKLPVIARSASDEAIPYNMNSDEIASASGLAMTDKNDALRTTDNAPDTTNPAPHTPSNASIQDIYNQYLEAFKSGAADIIKEDYDPVTQGIVTRKYFVGGFNGKMKDLAMLDAGRLPDSGVLGYLFRSVSVFMSPSNLETPSPLRNLLVLSNANIQEHMFLPNILDKIVDSKILTHQDVRRLITITLRKFGENQAEYYWNGMSLGVLKFLLCLHPEHFISHGEFNYERFLHKIKFTAGLGNFKLNRLYKRMKNQVDHYQRRVPGRLYYQNQLTAFRVLTIFHRQQASLDKYQKYFDVLSDLISSASSGMIVPPIRSVGLEEIGLDWNVAEVRRLDGKYRYFISTTADIAKTTSVWKRVADRLVFDPIVVYGGIQPLFRLEQEEVEGWREMVFPQIDMEIATYAFNTSAAKYTVDILAVSKLIDSLRRLGFEDKQIRIRINNQTGIMAGLLKANGLKVDQIREVGALLNELSASQANGKDDQEQLRADVMAKIDYYSKKYMFPDGVHEFFVQAIRFNRYDAELIERDFPYIADLIKELNEKLLILQRLYEGIPVVIAIDPTSFRNLSYGSLGIQADVTFDQSKYYAEISGGGCNFSDKPDYYLSGFALGIIRIASLLQEHGLHPRGDVISMTEQRIKEVVAQEHVSSPYIKSGEIPGSMGDGYKIETEIKVRPGSKKVVVVMHGLGGTRHEPVGELVNHMEGLDASLVRFTTSRQRQLMQSDERSLGKIFGNKTYAQELEDCRRVLKYVLMNSQRLLGVPREELEMVLIGSGAGGVSSVLLGAEFPQVKKIVLVNSGMSFDHAPKIKLAEGFPPQNALLSALEKFRGPLLSIRGSNNFIVTEQSAKDLVAKARSGRFVSIPGMRHFLPQTVRGQKMEKLSRLMRGFIDKASLVDSKSVKERASERIGLNHLNGPTSGRPAIDAAMMDSDKEVQSKALEVLSEYFPRFDITDVESVNRKVEGYHQQQIAGLMVNPLNGDVVTTDLWRSPWDESRAHRLKMVEAVIYERVGHLLEDNLWFDSRYVPIVGGKIYHKDGTPLSEEEVAQLGLKSLNKPDGQPLTVKMLATQGRVFAIPGPFIIPYVQEEDGGIRILSTYHSLAEVYGQSVNADNLKDVLTKLVQRGDIGLKIASALEFKGIGAHSLPVYPDDVPEGVKALSGHEAYIPAINFGHLSGNEIYHGGAGTISESTASSFVVDTQLRKAGAEMLADTVYSSRLFGQKEFPELADAQWKDVWFSVRMSYGSIRLSDLIYVGLSRDAGTFVDKNHLLHYYRDLLRIKDETELKQAILYFMLRSVARNIRALWTLGKRRKDSSDVEGNWGSFGEIIDTGGGSLVDAREQEKMLYAYSEYIAYVGDMIESLAKERGQNFDSFDYVTRQPFFRGAFLEPLLQSSSVVDDVEKEFRGLLDQRGLFGPSKLDAFSFWGVLEKNMKAQMVSNDVFKKLKALQTFLSHSVAEDVSVEELENKFLELWNAADALNKIGDKNGLTIRDMIGRQLDALRLYKDEQRRMSSADMQVFMKVIRAVRSIADQETIVFNSQGEDLVSVWERSNHELRVQSEELLPDLRSMVLTRSPEGHDYVAQYQKMTRAELNQTLQKMFDGPESRILGSFYGFRGKGGDLLTDFLDALTTGAGFSRVLRRFFSATQEISRGHYEAARDMLDTDYYRWSSERIEPLCQFAAFMKVLMQKSDQAMLNWRSESNADHGFPNTQTLEAKAEFHKGGIDLNQLNMQTSGQASQIQMPTDPVMLNQPIKVLVPKIIGVGTVNLGVFLGLSHDVPAKPDESDQLSFHDVFGRRDA